MAGIINLLGSVSYIIEILKGRVKPNKITWLLWGVIPIIAFSAEIYQGIGVTSFLTLTVGLGPLFIFAASFLNKEAYWRITKLDISLGFLSFFALIIWTLTKSANTAIIISIIADIFAGTPIIMKAWRNPVTEDYKAFLATIVATIITLLTIRVWNIANTAFPLYIMIVNLYLFTVLIFPKFRPFKNKGNNKIKFKRYI